MTQQKQLATEIVQAFRGAGHLALFVGGCVRDEALGVQPKDYDVVVSADPDKIISVLESAGFNTIEVGKAFGVIIANKDGEDVEVACFRTDGEYSDQRRPDSVELVLDVSLDDGIPRCVRADSERRDFKFNAIYFDPVTETIYDPTHGLIDDLYNNKVSFVGRAEDRIQEDPLRMLRFVRFVARFDTILNTEAADAIAAKASLIRNVSAERIADELTKILVGPQAGNAILLLQQLGLLSYVLPEVVMLGHKVTGQQQWEWHPEGSVLAHTCLMLNSMQSPSPVLAWGILLHDIAKPNTHKVRGGRITNYGHAEMGKSFAEVILRRLTFNAH